MKSDFAPTDENLEEVTDGVKLRSRCLTVKYGQHQVLHEVSLEIKEKQITALMGPSGCGKSTYIRCFNRMNDMIGGFSRSGQVELDGKDLYAPEVDVVRLRARVGIVFQKPNPFPKSIYDNVAYGPRIHGLAEQAAYAGSGKSHNWEWLGGYRRKKETKEALDQIVQHSLEQAGLWHEVKDRMKEPGTKLSGGQQQRLCIARALAVNPEVLLMDEPCSSLDSVSSAHIEELIGSLRERYTIVLVTHNSLQASRTAQIVAFFHQGRMIECGPSRGLFTNPRHEETQRYLTLSE